MSIGHHDRVLVIAEAGVNHGGSLARALALVDVAADAGADFVKFQTFRASALTTRGAGKADYQKERTGAGESQQAMLAALELSDADHLAIRGRCEERGVGFLSTPFDQRSLKFLVETMAVPLIKLSSGDLTNGPLLVGAARSGRPVVASTGMATMSEIEEALGCFAHGLTTAAEPASRAALREAWRDEHARVRVRERVTLLHCNTAYPTPIGDVNLRAMLAIRDAFEVRVGYSDHTLGIHVPVAAAALGAEVIEKHFTLNRSLPGPDHAASLEPDELASMVVAIRDIEAALGSGVKAPTESERANASVARKSLVTATRVRVGQRFSEANLTAKRPGTGRSPMDLWDTIGAVAKRDYEEDEVVS